jgi:hypothetical protein
VVLPIWPDVVETRAGMLLISVSTPVTSLANSHLRDPSSLQLIEVRVSSKLNGENVKWIAVLRLRWFALGMRQKSARRSNMD